MSARDRERWDRQVAALAEVQEAAADGATFSDDPPSLSSTDEPYASAWSGTVPDLLDAVGVDWVVAGAVADYQRLAIQRGFGAHVLTPEDVIVHKLIAWRPRDRDDIEVILSAGLTLDHAFIEQWSQEWDVLVGVTGRAVMEQAAAMTWPLGLVERYR